jgi:metallo-beta-lactamase family protein
MQVTVHGAAGEVTGSCCLLEAGGRRVLVDCGLIQGGRDSARRNAQPFPFEAAALDAVVLTHAHLDHSGRLPLLLKAGFKGRIFAHAATCDLARILLADSAYLQEMDAARDSRRRARRGQPPLAPLYTRAEAAAVTRHFAALPYGEWHDLLPHVRLRLRDAGHILGSSIVELAVGAGGSTRRLVVSGDLGQSGAPILRDPEPVVAADLLLMESTYGDRDHRDWNSTLTELGSVLDDACCGGGNVLIPAFAVGRTQELLYLFAEHYKVWDMKRWQIFVDSPLAIQATNTYAEYVSLYDHDARRALQRRGGLFKMANLHYSRTATQSAAINRISSGAIVLAGSGMCDGGRIRHHFKHQIWRERTHVLISGFQARGTLGRALVDGARDISLWGERVRVAAHIHTIGGLSAHAGQSGLLRWLGGFRGAPRVVLVHGEPQAISALQTAARDRLGVSCEAARAGERILI